MTAVKVAAFLKRPGAAEHVERAVADYRLQWQHETKRDTPAHVRKALRQIASTMTAAAELLEENDRTGTIGAPGWCDTGLLQAWRLADVVTQERGLTRPKHAGASTAAALREFGLAATLAQSRTATTRHARSATRMAADSVRAILEHQGERVTLHVASLAVLLLRHVAQQAGDRHLTPKAALKALRESAGASSHGTTRRKRPNK